MTTYVICDNCGAKFTSPIQVSNLETNLVSGNPAQCPECNQITPVENRNMINE